MQISRVKHTITTEAARAIADGAIAAAEARGKAIGVCVADADGAPVVLILMDGVGAPIADFCKEKAYTAAVTGLSTHDFYAHITSSPSLEMGMIGRPNFLLWDGGHPIFHDGTVIGGIGVSGGSELEDREIVQAALSEILAPSNTEH